MIRRCEHCFYFIPNYKQKKPQNRAKVRDGKCAWTKKLRPMYKKFNCDHYKLDPLKLKEEEGL